MESFLSSRARHSENKFMMVVFNALRVMIWGRKRVFSCWIKWIWFFEFFHSFRFLCGIRKEYVQKILPRHRHPSSLPLQTRRRWRDDVLLSATRVLSVFVNIYIYTYEFYNNNTQKAALVRGRSRVVLFKKYTRQVKKILLSKTCLCLLVIRFNTVVVVFRRPAFL